MNPHLALPATRADGINFIERTGNFEGYSIDKDGIATYTTGFEQFLS